MYWFWLELGIRFKCGKIALKRGHFQDFENLE